MVYGILALVAYWPVWPGDPSRMSACACGDRLQQAWFLAWTPFALLHGHNPFLTNFIDFPGGANLAVNPLMSLLGLLGLPLTLGAGPVSTLNLWFWLAFPLSATACFALLRRWVRWAPAAFVGGLLYGFSPYMLGQGGAHLQLLLVPLPPIILLLLDELLVRRGRRPAALGALVGVAGAAQYLVSAEVFASTLVMAVLGVVVLVLSRPRLVLAHLRHTLAAAGVAAAVCALLIGYPVSVQLFGPDRFVGSAHGSYPFAADLLGSVVPTVHQLLAPSGLVTVSNRFILGDITENGSYLGIPLLVLLVVVVVWRWRLPVVRFSALMGVLAELISLGPSLTVDGHDTGIGLPAALLDHVSLFTSFDYARFSVYVDLFAAVLVAVGIDQWLAPAAQRTRSRHRRQTSPAISARHRAPTAAGAGWWRPAVLLVTLAVGLVPLIPDWPYPAVDAGAPPLFTSAAIQRIPAGSVVMTYPYADTATDRGMLWQEAASMRFRLVGGYALVPGPGGAASYDPFPDQLRSVPATLVADEAGTTPEAVTPAVTAATPSEVRRFLRRYRVDTVLDQPIGAHPRRALELLRAAIGPPIHTGGLEVWFDVQRRLGGARLRSANGPRALPRSPGVAEHGPAPR
ncbi:MAG: hypothetical protein ACRDY3_05725 [Acidimicrobiales bacterium]